MSDKWPKRPRVLEPNSGYVRRTEGGFTLSASSLAEFEASTTRIRVDGVNIAFRTWGDGPPLVLVHGLGANSLLWIKQLDALGASHRLIAVDLRGFGQSDRPRAAGAYTIDRFADDIVTLVRELGIGKIDYLGTSMGGFIGQALALKAPELINRLILAHTAAQMTMPLSILEKRLAVLRELPMSEFSKLVGAQALADGVDSPEFGWLCQMIERNDPDVYAQVLGEGLSGFDLRSQVDQIRLPTLVIVGDKDRVIPPEGGYALAEAIAGARLASLTGAGHIGYAEQPQAFNRHVLGFLDIAVSKT